MHLAPHGHLGHGASAISLADGGLAGPGHHQPAIDHETAVGGRIRADDRFDPAFDLQIAVANAVAALLHDRHRAAAEAKHDGNLLVRLDGIEGDRAQRAPRAGGEEQREATLGQASQGEAAVGADGGGDLGMSLQGHGDGLGRGTDR